MNAVTLVGYHFPKTGGTSLHAHAVQHLGEKHHYPLGPHNDTRRLYNGLPLLAEFDESQARNIRFINGHGVSFLSLACLPSNEIALFAVCRHPVERFISSYKHYIRYRREAKPLSARATFERQGPSPFAKEMMTRFVQLADPNARTDEEKLISILRSFRFVLRTETLSDCSADLFGAIGLPPLAWKRRVHSEEADLGDLTREEIAQRDHLDMLVHSAISAAEHDAVSSNLGSNPFGYDPAPLAEARRRLAEEAKDQKNRIEKAYERLFNFHQADGRIHATNVFLQRSGSATARREFADYCRRRSLNLDLKDLPARNWCFVSDMYGFLRDRRGQREAAEAALAAQPDYPRANFLVGREAARLGDYDRALSLLTVASELNPTRPEVWTWLARITKRRGDGGAAGDFIDRAIGLNPDSPRVQRLHRRISEKGNRQASLVLDDEEA